MLEINTSEFGDYDQQGLLEYLVLHEETSFQVIMPKKSLPYKDENIAIYWQYYLAALAGQKLSEISTLFEYFVPCEFVAIDFRFHFKTENMEKLSEVLFTIINGCYHVNDAYNKFHDEGTIFFESAMDGKIKAATWGLLRIADKYLEE